MDIVDWVMYVSGGAFGLLTLGLALSRASAFTERDVNPVWWVGFIVFGAVLAVTLIVDWLVPIETTIYLANGGDTPREVHLAKRIVCIPGKSYDGFRWRVDPPDALIVVGSGGERDISYRIGKGTWFINTSKTSVAADMYSDGGNAITFDALFTRSSGAIHVDSRYGRPLRMFSQSSLDRIYSPAGDVLRRSISGPCPNSANEKKAETDSSSVTP